MRCIEREEFDIAVVDQGSAAFEGRRVIRHLVRYKSPYRSSCWHDWDAEFCQEALNSGDSAEKPVSTTRSIGS
jgi:hypothetical protein